MLMFRRRRAGLYKRLVRARLASGDSAGESDQPREPALRRLFKRLDDERLEMLVTAVEARDGSPGCLLIDDPTSSDEPAHLLTCQLFRWANLDAASELKRLPECKSADSSVCCNPYHWSRMCSTGELPIFFNYLSTI